ncbi:MAG: hypothetical protein NC310_01150 [Roseburia sp.]|nr:hypothetical protein [Anaeroplasma bactoclasticum]MCM1195660.1 hypothetical protein [Roseburia sp.]
MKITIDFGTKFTYIGTCNDRGEFIPLLDNRIIDKGYPTTIEAKEFENDEINENNTLIDGTLFTCYSGKGAGRVKKILIELIRNSTMKSAEQILYSLFNSSPNLTYLTKDIFIALFTVLLKKTLFFCENNSLFLAEKNINYEMLEAIYIAFPEFSTIPNTYQSILQHCMRQAVINSNWITSKDILYACVEEAKCLPYALNFKNKYVNEEVLFIDIGGYTSDYCYLDKEGKLNRNNAISIDTGTDEIDRILLMYINENTPSLFNLYMNNPIELDTLKRQLEQGHMEANILPVEYRDSLIDNRGKLVWNVLKEKIFHKLKELFPIVNTIVLSGGGSNIANIVEQAKVVFPNATVTTIQLENQNSGESYLNSKSIICYGAYLQANDRVERSKQDDNIASDREYEKKVCQMDNIMANDGEDLFNNYNEDDDYMYMLMTQGPYQRDSYSELRSFIYGRSGSTAENITYTEKLLFGRLKSENIKPGFSIQESEWSNYLNYQLKELDKSEDNVVVIKKKTTNQTVSVLIGVVTYVYNIMPVYHVLAIYNDSGETISVKNGEGYKEIKHRELIKDIIFFNRVYISDLSTLKRAPHTADEYLENKKKLENSLE